MLDNVRKCKECGKLFNFIGRPVCPECLKKLDDDFQEVRKYIYENPNTGIEEVSEETGVSVKTIMRFLREGRLQLRSASNALLCEKCGKPLSTGTMCEDCKKKLTDTLDSKLAPKPSEQPEKKEKSGQKVADKLHINLDRK